MSIDVRDEIVQDFLVEGGEILDSLSRQLVDLEQRPDDAALLNSVFRGFHTIKGGAGFLGLENLVTVSHKAEDVFDLLRRGERAVDARLMDVVLEVLDTLHGMFDEIRDGREPPAAQAALIEALIELRDPSAAVAMPAAAGAANPVVSAEVMPTAVPGHASAASPIEPQAVEVEAPPAPGDLITDSEFEALLDQLHGARQHGSAPAQNSLPGAEAAEITEAEFDALLDHIHGTGRHGAAQAAATPSSTAAVGSAASPQEETPDTAAAAAPESASPKPAKAQASSPAQADSTVRVETAVLDQIMNMVGELVLIRNRLSTLDASIGNEEMTRTVQSLDHVTADLQAAAMRTRMQPIKKVFGRFPRVVRDLARSMNKAIELVLEGEDTDLDKNLVEALADPLVHLVRNACDHGIERPEIREAHDKPRHGTITLRAEQEGDHILLTISDDGAGMDAERLRAKAVEKGMMDADVAARLDDRECFNLIFAPGFSTKSEISDISGRGVGMDVVKTRINQLNGQIEVKSALGKGTSIEIKVPLTLAIMPTLMVVLGTQIFALPLVNVNEILDYDLCQASTVDGRQVIVVRGKALPLFYLSRWLVKGTHDYPESRGHVVIVNAGTQRMGLLVDQLIGQEEVVIKPLGALLQGTDGLAGATITGDGRIALILDLPSLVQAYVRRR